jgi:hypothetical protein
MKLIPKGIKTQHIIIAAVVIGGIYWYTKHKAQSGLARRRAYPGFLSNQEPPIGYGTMWAPLTDPGVGHSDQSNTMPYFDLTAPHPINLNGLNPSGYTTQTENPATYSSTGFNVPLARFSGGVGITNQ